MMLRGLVSLLALAVFALPAVAHADDPPEGTAVPATAGASAEAVFNAVTDAHYAALSDDKPCGAAGCKQTVVKKAAIGDAGEVQLRKTSINFGDVYGIVLGKDASWWAPDVLDDIQPEDCATNKCSHQKLGQVTMTRVKDVVWITMQVHDKLTHDEPRSTESHDYGIVVACKLGATPLCARVHGGGMYDAGSAKVKDGAVVVHDGDGNRTVPIKF